MKDLIKDIITYLKDNEEARERFKIAYEDRIMRPYNFNNLLISQKKAVLITALSSPNGKPICGFLEIEEMREVSAELEIGIKTKTHMLMPINHAKILRTIYLDALDEGKNHDDAYKLINDKYNEL